MRRTEIERQLRQMGFAPLGQRTAKGHMAWYSRHGRVSVPHTVDGDELILDEIGEGILARARALIEGDEGDEGDE